MQPNALERAAKLEVEAEGARLEAEKERLERVKTEERVAWRRLTREQQTYIASRLKAFAGQVATVWFNAGDTEGSALAHSIDSILRAAAWNSPKRPQALMTMGEGAVETGVGVASTGDDKARAASAAVVQESMALGFDAYKSPRTETRAVPLVIVTVRARPEGPQGEAKLKKQNRSGSSSP